MAAIAKLFGTILTLMILGYVAFFAVVNDAVIQLTLWPQSAPIEAPIWLITLCAFCAGLLLIALLASMRISALRLSVYRTEKKLTHKTDALAQASQISSTKDAPHSASERLSFHDK